MCKVWKYSLLQEWICVMAVLPQMQHQGSCPFAFELWDSDRQIKLYQFCLTLAGDNISDCLCFANSAPPPNSFSPEDTHTILEDLPSNWIAEAFSKVRKGGILVNKRFVCFRVTYLGRQNCSRGQSLWSSLKLEKAGMFVNERLVCFRVTYLGRETCFRGQIFWCWHIPLWLLPPISWRSGLPLLLITI